MVTTGHGSTPGLRRAVVLMTASSFLVPAAGVLTQPILAQALGVEGRGELAAAIAPAALAISVATLGLPEALTYYLAKHPRLTRRALLSATVVSLGLGMLCLAATYVALPFLSTGDTGLGSLILLAMAVTVPALAVGVARGAATGRQMWNAVAAERLINTLVRIVAFVVLWYLDELDVLTAVLVSVVSPLIAGVVYWRLIRPAPHDPLERAPDGPITSLLLSYGSRMWLGAVASMLLARLGQILMAPLSSVEDLGLYSVATTIADLPLVVAVAIQGTLFGVNSKTTDAGKLTAATRLTLLFGAVGCVAIGATLPLWIGPLFGDGFVAATVPTLMLLFSALVCIPGLMAATGVSAWGRPGLRSLGLAITLIVNLGVFVVLVPHLGVIGGCVTSIVSNVVMTGFMVVAAGRVMGVPVTDFVLVRGPDVRRAVDETTRLLRWARRRSRSPR